MRHLLRGLNLARLVASLLISLSRCCTARSTRAALAPPIAPLLYGICSLRIAARSLATFCPIFSVDSIHKPLVIARTYLLNTQPLWRARDRSNIGSIDIDSASQIVGSFSRRLAICGARMGQQRRLQQCRGRTQERKQRRGEENSGKGGGMSLERVL